MFNIVISNYILENSDLLSDIDFLEEYKTGINNIVHDFYKPAFSQSIEYWRAVGYFRSSSLEAFGNSLQSFLASGGKIKLITSVELTKEDSDAIERGTNKKVVCEDRINSIIESEFKDGIGDGLSRLVELLRIGRLEIKIAIPKNTKGYGIYHEKVGVFFDINGNYLAFSGSANETTNAFENNFESIDVFTSWEDSSRTLNKKNHFETLWENTNLGCDTYNFSEASKQKIIKFTKDYNDSRGKQKINTQTINKLPSLPEWIEIRDYQKEAYEEWKKNDYHGILSMATGTGKTITAFNALINLLQSEKYLAVVVVVPYQHLVTQWAEEANEFGITFIKCFESSKKWSSPLLESITSYKYKEQKNIFIITTTSTYISPKFQDPISKRTNLCLVVDEAHNFGASKIQKFYLPNANFRLGLSATPNRYMDEEGTTAIFNYLGNIIYNFSLAKAIEMKMLTPYKYYPILVHLTEMEQSEYIELSRKISKISIFDDDKNNEILKTLLMKRAKIIAGAENKLPALRETLITYKLENSSFNLFYCAAKTTGDEENAMRMVEEVKLLVESLGMNVESFTAMDSPSQSERSTLITHIKKQIIDGLVAIRCLDEGVDIPDVRRAFILSSSSNPKEFIQRRGRVLRKAKNKEFAEIYDFLVVPYGYSSDEEYKANRKYLNKELIRYREFAELALNKAECEEPLIDIMSEYHLLHI